MMCRCADVLIVLISTSSNQHINTSNIFVVKNSKKGKWGNGEKLCHQGWEIIAKYIPRIQRSCDIFVEICSASEAKLRSSNIFPFL